MNEETNLPYGLKLANLGAERDSLRDAVIGTICRQDAPEPGHWLMPAWDFGRELRAERDELRARLAETEAQEPVCRLFGNSVQFNPAARMPEDGLLYARHVPAIPDGWKLVPVEPTEAMLEAEADACGLAWGAMIAAAPEHKA